MLKRFKKTQEQWGGSNDVIDHWLDTRQTLIVEYCKLAALQPAGTKSNVIELPSAEEIHDFCARMVNYISDGHFKIYDMVIDRWHATGFKTNQEIDASYARIVATTDPLLNFSDKYLDINDKDDLIDFETEFSEVGEVLVDRFEREDHLIQLIADSLSIPPGA